MTGSDNHRIEGSHRHTRVRVSLHDVATSIVPCTLVFKSVQGSDVGNTREAVPSTHQTSWITTVYLSTRHGPVDRAKGAVAVYVVRVPVPINKSSGDPAHCLLPWLRMAGGLMSQVPHTGLYHIRRFLLRLAANQYVAMNM